MRFARPELLWLLALVPVLAFWLGLSLVRRRRALAVFAQEALVGRLVQAAPAGRLALKAALLVFGVIFLVLAAARPQWGTTLQQVSRQGVDVMLAIDISESMLAEDIKPSRLEKAREEAARLLDRLEGDRVGLVAFAGSGGVLCPLTLDYNAVRLFLDALSTDLISYPGSALGEAIKAATTGFGAEERKFKVMVMLTDGEEQVSDEDAIRQAEEAAAQGLVIHAIGVGTPEGEPIPRRSSSGVVGGYKKDKDGRVVTTRLNEPLLERISGMTGGRYFAATAAETELEQVTELIAGMDKKEMQQRLTTQYEERYQIPLAIGLGALLAEALITGRRRRRLPAAAVMILLALLLPGGRVLAQSVASLVEEGNRLYREGRLSEALEAYRRAQKQAPGLPALHYNIGNVLYRQGEYDKAYDAYRLAFPAREKELAEGARYNAGNTHFARRNWQDAIRNYQEALRLDPADMDAKKNLELALRQMEEEQKKQQQQKQQQDQQEDQEDQQQNQQPREQNQDRREGGPPQQREQRPSPNEQEKLSRQEAMRILDAMREQDRPPKDQLKVPPPDKRPERDW